jgi:hypothetical protein
VANMEMEWDIGHLQIVIINIGAMLAFSHAVKVDMFWLPKTFLDQPTRVQRYPLRIRHT